MAIDVFTERVVTLTEATRLLPRRRAGKKPHTSTLYRWATRGLRGVQLETVQVGGSTCTSQESLQRFFDRLQAVGSHGQPSPERPPQKRVDDAERILRESKF